MALSCGHFDCMLGKARRQGRYQRCCRCADQRTDLQLATTMYVDGMGDVGVNCRHAFYCQPCKVAHYDQCCIVMETIMEKVKQALKSKINSNYREGNSKTLGGMSSTHSTLAKHFAYCEAGLSVDIDETAYPFPAFFHIYRCLPSELRLDIVKRKVNFWGAVNDMELHVEYRLKVSNLAKDLGHDPDVVFRTVCASAVALLFSVPLEQIKIYSTEGRVLKELFKRMMRYLHKSYGKGHIPIVMNQEIRADLVSRFLKDDRLKDMFLGVKKTIKPSFANNPPIVFHEYLPTPDVLPSPKVLDFAGFPDEDGGEGASTDFPAVLPEDCEQAEVEE